MLRTPAPWRIRLASRLILKPTRQPLEASHLQRFIIEARGLKQELYCSTGSIGAVAPKIWFLKIPGSTGRAEKATSFPADRLGFPSAVLTWNPPGYGQSEGEANLNLMAELLPEVVDGIVTELNWASIPMFVMGTSLGGALAVYLVTQRNVAGSVLCNPPSLPELMSRYNRWWNLGLGGSFLAHSIPPSLQTVAVAQYAKTPAVLITSLSDRVVPPELQHRIATSYAGPMKCVEMAGAGHELRMADLPKDKMQSALQWLLMQAGVE